MTASPTNAKRPLRQRQLPGNLRCSIMGCAAELASGRWPSAQTAAASQFTKFGRSTATKRSPCPALLGAGRRGVGQPKTNGLLESCFLSRYLVIYAAGAHSERASSYQFHRAAIAHRREMLYLDHLNLLSLQRASGARQQLSKT